MNPCSYAGRMRKPTPTRYRTTNWSSYNASLRKQGSLLIWVDKDMTWRAPRDGGLRCYLMRLYNSACRSRWDCCINALVSNVRLMAQLVTRRFRRGWR